MSDFRDILLKLFDDWVGENQALVVGLIIGVTGTALFNYFWSSRYMRKAYQKVEAEKDARINELKLIVYERLENIEVEKIDKNLWKKIIKFFKPF